MSDDLLLRREDRAKEAYFSIWCCLAFTPLLFCFLVLENDGITPGFQVGGLFFKFFYKLLSILSVIIYLRLSVRRFSFTQIICYIGVGFPIVGFSALSLISGESLYLQAINALLFLPLLAFSWYESDARFRIVFGSIFRIVLLQIFLSLLLPELFSSGWGNNGMSGALGNANSFSLFCILSFFWFMLVESRVLYSLIALVGCFLTGSLAALLILTLVSFSVFNLWRSVPAVIVISSLSTAALGYFSEPLIRSLNHAIQKFFALTELLFSGSTDGSLSISGRLEYWSQGLSLMSLDPLAWLWGHPKGVIMYSGDGYFLAILVTHGFPALFLFAASLFVMLARKNSCCDMRLVRFSRISIFVYLLYLIPNRILDYFPSALIFFLVTGYLLSLRRSIPSTHSLRVSQVRA